MNGPGWAFKLGEISSDMAYQINKEKVMCLYHTLLILTVWIWSLQFQCHNSVKLLWSGLEVILNIFHCLRFIVGKANKVWGKIKYLILHGFHIKYKFEGHRKYHNANIYTYMCVYKYVYKQSKRKFHAKIKIAYEYHGKQVH